MNGLAEGCAASSWTRTRLNLKKGTDDSRHVEDLKRPGKDCERFRMYRRKTLLPGLEIIDHKNLYDGHIAPGYGGSQLSIAH
jgi:hypothetical protein